MVLELVAAALVGLAALWLVLQPLVWPGRPSAPVYEPPDPEETPKGIALAALKEIEFDRATGKLSDEDYALLKRKYTGVALEAMRAESGSVTEGPNAGDAATHVAAAPVVDRASDVDESDVDRMIAARVRAIRSAAGAVPSGAPVCEQCGPRPEADAVFCSMCGARLCAGGACAGCGADLDQGSRFCEQCGTAVAA